MDTSLTYISAFIIGLLGGAHCIGMCGGLMNALSFAVPQQHSPWRHGSVLMLYNLGRILSYSIAGAAIGSLGWWLQNQGSAIGPVLRIIAGVMLIAMGLYLAGWWRVLTHLESMGGRLWKYLQPVGNKLMPVTRPWQALLLGIVWGWLPCGLVYSTLTLAAAEASWQQSALIMASFGAGTLPVMMLTGIFAHHVKTWIRKSSVRQLSAVMIIIFGLWTLATPLLHTKHQQHNENSTQPGNTNPNQPANGHQHH